MRNPIEDRITTLANRFAPSIAAERICDQFIVIDREELPEMVAGRFGNYLVIGDQKFAVPDCDAQKLRQIAGGLFVYAEQIQDDAKEAAKNKRRDELALEFGSSALGYKDTFDSTQRAIDRIIELEQAQP